MKNIIIISFISFIFTQNTFTLEDINPTSLSYQQEIGPWYYPGDVTLYYFGHQS